MIPYEVPAPRLTAAGRGPLPASSRTGIGRWGLPLSACLHAGVLAGAILLNLRNPEPATLAAVAAVELTLIEEPVNSPSDPSVAEPDLAEPLPAATADPSVGDATSSEPPPASPSAAPPPPPPVKPASARSRAVSRQTPGPATVRTAPVPGGPAAPVEPHRPPPRPEPPPGGPPPDYLAAIQARLARHKVYPRSAQLAREEGTVRIRFTVGADGTILDWKLLKGSGSDGLDRAAAAMLERASPLPPIPAELGLDRMDIVLPVRFALR